MKITLNYTKEFFESEKSGGIILIFCTLISIVISNMSFGNNYLSFWEVQIGGHSLIHWINDGLMAIFFLLIGLELKREINLGELSNIKNALLPIFATIGGMLVPAAIYSAFNYGASFINRVQAFQWLLTLHFRWAYCRYWANVYQHRSKYFWLHWPSSTI